MTPDRRQPVASSADAPADSARTITRRRALLATGALGAASIAGCLDSAGDDTDGGGGSTSGLPPCSGDQYDDPGRALEGESSAPVTVELFEDFACPHCATLNQSVLPGIREDYVEAGDVALVHRDFPVPVSDWSWRVANVARLVQREAGAEAFFAFTDAAFANYQDYSEELVTSLASDEGVDADAAQSALDDRPFCSFIRDERESGLDRGVEGTPTAFVGDERLTAPSDEELRDAIDSAL